MPFHKLFACSDILLFERSLFLLRKTTINAGQLEVWGLEPQTYGLQSHRSSQLSYTPGYFLVLKLLKRS
jgi:hypothetical protein